MNIKNNKYHFYKMYYEKVFKDNKLIQYLNVLH